MNNTMQTHHILMIDDDEEDYQILKKSIEKIDNHTYSLDWLSNWDKAPNIYYLTSYDIVLVDYRLGALNGTSIIREAVQAGLSMAFILLTGMDDPNADAEAQAAGAMDFLVKGAFSPRELDRSLRYSLARALDFAAIRQLNTKLEERVQERTQSLQDTIRALESQVQITSAAHQKVDEILQVLKKSLEKEQELSALKSSFVSLVSHEFRTPLTSIGSSADLIMIYAERKEPEKAKKHAERIKHSVENLTTILGEFLSLGKLEEGKITAHLREMNLPELINDVRDELRYSFKQGQTLTYQHEGGAMVFLDSHLSKNILLNLMSNAIKYSPENTPICVKSSVQIPGKVRIEVRDQGIGISEEDQMQLFNRFFRAGNASNVQGTGLGLYIVKNYVEMMNGTIGCESHLGKGSTFWVEFEVGQSPDIVQG
jgi:signal transduction histidine kinase